MLRLLVLTGSLAVLIGSLVLGIWATSLGAEALHGAISVRCTNPYSGAMWQISVDYDHSTVDSNPASISDAEIAWRDVSTGWYYTLDRKSGNLKITLASATGGNFLYDHCNLEQ